MDFFPLKKSFCEKNVNSVRVIVEALPSSRLFPAHRVKDLKKCSCFSSISEEKETIKKDTFGPYRFILFYYFHEAVNWTIEMKI